MLHPEGGKGPEREGTEPAVRETVEPGHGVPSAEEPFLLRQDEVQEGRSLKQQKICERGSELQDKLAKKLNTEEQEMLSELVEILFKESCYDEQKKFERGFRLGVLITAEVFTEQNIFL